MPATVECWGVETGLTLSAKLFTDGSDTVAATETATEATNRKGVYTFPNTGDLTGLHGVILLEGSTPKWYGWAYLATSGTVPTYDIRLEALAGQSSGLALKSDVPTTEQIEASLLNEGDANALIQAIADKIATDWTAGDLSALAIVSAIKADATLAQMIQRIDAAVTSRLASASYTAPDNATISAIQTLVDALPTLSEILAGGDVDGFTLEQSLKLILAGLAGKLSGAAGTTITIRSADDTANRIVATVDSSGNRSAVTLDAAG